MIPIASDMGGNGALLKNTVSNVVKVHGTSANTNTSAHDHQITQIIPLFYFFHKILQVCQPL